MCGKKNPDCGCSAEEKIAHAKEHPEEHEAETLQSVVAAVGELDAETGLPTQWHGVLCVEGLRTTDHRRVAPLALSWRQLPLVICAQFEDVHGYGDIPPSPIVGSITNIWRDELTGMVMAEGTFDLSIEAGVQAATMCKNQTLRWNSVDLEILSSQYVEVSASPDGEQDIMDILLDGEYLEAPPTDWYDEILEARIMKTTMVSTPAFPQCVVAPIDVPLDIPEPMGIALQVSEGLLASGVTIPVSPPASWFKNPEFSELTPATITPDGRYFGHLAPFDSCHIGFADVCTTAPRTTSNYAHFMTGQIECDGGELVQIGQITFNTGHAGMNLRASDTTHHYDHTGSVAADVAVGEDEFGIWFAGALRPGLTEQDVRAIRAAPLSGDWRDIGGKLQLVAALAVNVPGFPIVAAGKRQGKQVSLVAGGVRKPDPLKEMAKEIATLRQAIRPLMGQSVEQLKRRVHPQTPAKLAVVASLKERIGA